MRKKDRWIETIYRDDFFLKHIGRENMGVKKAIDGVQEGAAKAIYNMLPGPGKVECWQCHEMISPGLSECPECGAEL